MEERAIPGDFSNDLVDKGCLEIFPGLLRAAEYVAAEQGGGGDATAALAALETTPVLLEEFTRMRLEMLPKKENLRALNNWLGTTLLAAASKALSMATNAP